MADGGTDTNSTRYFENIDRFWSITTSPDGLTTTVRYGKHGTRGNPSGQSRSKTHASPQDADIYVENLIRVKSREGFVENRTGRIFAEDGGVQAALDEADNGGEEVSKRATRSAVGVSVGSPPIVAAAAPAPVAPVTGKRANSSGTGKRKGKKLKTDDAVDVAGAHATGQGGVGASEEDGGGDQETADAENENEGTVTTADDPISGAHPTLTTATAPEESTGSPQGEPDYEATDVIADTIAMFEAQVGHDDLVNLAADEEADEMQAENEETEMPRIKETEVEMEVVPEELPVPTTRSVEPTPEPSGDPEPTITPIITPPSPPTLPLPSHPSPQQPSQENQTNVLVEELKTTEEEKMAREELGFDATPALPIVREPSEEPGPVVVTVENVDETAGV